MSVENRLDQARAAWDRASAIGDEHTEDISYLMEMVKHPGSQLGLAAALVTSVPLLFASGVGVAALPVILLLTGEALAGIFLPSSPVFQEYINRGKRKDAREKLREHLLREITFRMPDDMHRWEPEQQGQIMAMFVEAEDYEPAGHYGQRRRGREFQTLWNNYYDMLSRLEALRRRKVAEDRASRVTMRDLERMEETTLTYLKKVSTLLDLLDAQDGLDVEQTNREIRAMARQLESDAEMRPSTRAKLERSKAELEAMVKRHLTLDPDILAARASLTAMHGAFAELIRRVTDPHRGMDDEYLSESIEKLVQEEELDFEISSELSSVGAHSADMNDRLERIRKAAASRQKGVH